MIEEEEFVLVRRKRYEKVRLEVLRLDEEAVFALVIAKVIDEELNEFGLDVYKEFNAFEFSFVSFN